ncbi:MAG: orotidine-5'-phosphate decarboxylase [Anaerolineae bacterium]|nr:orotidine-5'-phosphate decarboxylase [Thermoflexales bacterium]MDW8408599.1 orotidine-5'-phosphate decarboxylase [Anaerolineae bacterium]
MTFLEKLARAQQINRSFLCVGLDIVVANTPLPLQLEDEPMLPFARAIIEATQDLVCAYKPNLGFYLAEGAAGIVALERIVRLIPDHIPIILDGKFGDIGNTAEAYARGAFEQFRADAVTLSPYIGSDSIQPFLRYAERGVFVLARTSNPNAGEFQNLPIDSGVRLYERVAHMANAWHAQGPGACGLVVGATAPHELQRLREIAPHLPFLIPGVGAQGGDLEAAIRFGRTRDGLGPVINVSRAVVYASRTMTFAEDARKAAQTLVDTMRVLGQMD